MLRFLDIEAGEGDDDGEEDDVDDVGDFLENVDDEIEDDNWYETRHNISAALDAQISDKSDDYWGSFLSRAHERALKPRATSVCDDSTPSFLVQTAYDILASASWIPRKSDPNGFLWRVPVRVGYEESTTFTLYNKYVMGGSAFSGIRSILGRRNQPGAIYLEAPDAKDVVKLCENVSDLFIRGIMPIPPDDARLCLNHPPSSNPEADSWARITKSRLYKGDLVYVQKFDATSGADVLVVPRIDLDSSSQKSRLPHPKPRPPQKRLELEAIYRRFGPNAVQVDGDSFVFRSQKYHISGFCQIKTHHLSTSSLPTTTELSNFADCPLISAGSVFDVILNLANNGLKRYDPVKITRGQLRGALGIINFLDDDNSIATVMIAGSDKGVELPTSYLRKHFQVGDQVDIIDGSHKGKVGWVTAFSQQKLILWDDRTQVEMVVTPNCAAFHRNPQVLDSMPSPTPSIRLPSKLIQDPLNFLTGHQVTIVGSHINKGYDGYIKNTLHDGSVVVETEAGLRDIVVNLHNVSNRDNSRLAPLSRTDLIKSQLPLLVSTPLPSGSSVSSAPAWHHPLSNPGSVGDYIPGVVSPKLCDNPSLGSFVENSRSSVEQSKSFVDENTKGSKLGI
ncbi:hypothetical protein H0H93_004845 [Arthromyces matolae]|nr:hypothetical protein H0H93_004845 [Arthromyces matolae]